MSFIDYGYVNVHLKLHDCDSGDAREQAQVWGTLSMWDPQLNRFVDLVSLPAKCLENALRSVRFLNEHAVCRLSVLSDQTQYKDIVWRKPYGNLFGHRLEPTLAELMANDIAERAGEIGYVKRYEEILSGYRYGNIDRFEVMSQGIKKALSDDEIKEIRLSRSWIDQGHFFLRDTKSTGVPSFPVSVAGVNVYIFESRAFEPGKAFAVCSDFRFEGPVYDFTFYLRHFSALRNDGIHGIPIASNVPPMPEEMADRLSESEFLRDLAPILAETIESTAFAIGVSSYARSALFLKLEPDPVLCLIGNSPLFRGDSKAFWKLDSKSSAFKKAEFGSRNPFDSAIDQISEIMEHSTKNGPESQFAQQVLSGASLDSTRPELMLELSLESFTDPEVMKNVKKKLKQARHELIPMNEGAFSEISEISETPEMEPCF